MANSPQARKRAQQDKQHGRHNASRRSRVRTFIKRVIRTITASDSARAEAEFKTAVPVIDSAVNKGLIHRNKAARHKRRLNARIKALKAVLAPS